MLLVLATFHFFHHHPLYYYYYYRSLDRGAFPAEMFDLFPDNIDHVKCTRRRDHAMVHGQWNQISHGTLVHSNWATYNWSTTRVYLGPVAVAVNDLEMVDLAKEGPLLLLLSNLWLTFETISSLMIKVVGINIQVFFPTELSDWRPMEQKPKKWGQSQSPDGPADSPDMVTILWCL